MTGKDAPVGQVFGQLTVIGRGERYVTPKGKSSHTWRVRCSCGTERDMQPSNLRAGRAVSCGCAPQKPRKRLHEGCDIEGCARPHYARALCQMHYIRARRVLRPRKPRTPRPPRFCSVEGCGRKYHARELCNVHYSRAFRAGEFKEKAK